MRKQELIKIVAERAKLTPSQAEDALTHTFDAIKQLMASQETVQIPKFGSFGARVRTARKGRNPSTGETIQIPEMMVPYFKAASQLKEAINKQADD